MTRGAAGRGARRRDARAAGVRARRVLAGAALVVVLALGRSAGAAPPEPDPDPWFGQDKALHFAASSTIAAGGYAVGAALFDARGHALLFGGALAAAAGIGKEALDLTGFGDPSWRDLAWDGIGTFAGLAVAWGVDLLVRGVSSKRPLFVMPAAGTPQGGLRFGLVF
jgi:putative lipoprotein